jgi:hypothetical protein
MVLPSHKSRANLRIPLSKFCGAAEDSTRPVMCYYRRVPAADLLSSAPQLEVRVPRGTSNMGPRVRKFGRRGTRRGPGLLQVERLLFVAVASNRISTGILAAEVLPCAAQLSAMPSRLAADKDRRSCQVVAIASN